MESKRTDESTPDEVPGRSHETLYASSMYTSTAFDSKYKYQRVPVTRA